MAESDPKLAEPNSRGAILLVLMSIIGVEIGYAASSEITHLGALKRFTIMPLLLLRWDCYVPSQKRVVASIH